MGLMGHDPLKTLCGESTIDHSSNPNLHKAKGLIISLSNDVDKEDLNKLMDAILLFEGILGVDFIDCDQKDDYINRRRIKNELLEEIGQVLTLRKYDETK